MKYKEGNRVRIKSLNWYNKNKDKNGNIVFSSKVPHFALCVNVRTVFTKDMVKYCGKVVTIENVWTANYSIVEGTHRDYFTDEMIEGLVEEETKVGTALNPIEPKSNANCLTQERVDEMSLDKAGQITDFEYEGLAYTLPKGYIFKDENGNVINATKIVLEKKKKEYPKTYEECCKILNTDDDSIIDISVPLHYNHLLISFTQLIICRDAYWKIAGGEMELGKPWEPDWSIYEHKFCLGTDKDKVIEECVTTGNRILAFPTEEMRDAFYENFKEEIEICKELL